MILGNTHTHTHARAGTHKHDIPHHTPKFKQTEQQKKKKDETELTASVLKTRSITHKRLKEHLLIGRKKKKTKHFLRSPFQATYNIET